MEQDLLGGVRFGHAAEADRLARSAGLDLAGQDHVATVDLGEMVQERPRGVSRSALQGSSRSIPASSRSVCTFSAGTLQQVVQRPLFVPGRLDVQLALRTAEPRDDWTQPLFSLPFNSPR